MKKQLIETGKIVTTHGINGFVKVQPWCDYPDFLLDFDTLYFEDGSEVKILSSTIHKNCVLMNLEGINSINDAEKLVNRVLYLDKEDVELDEGTFFIKDLIGLNVFDVTTNQTLGTIKDILTQTGQDIYVIKTADKDILIPAVKEFIVDISLENKLITLKTIEGML